MKAARHATKGVEWPASSALVADQLLERPQALEALRFLGGNIIAIRATIGFVDARLGWHGAHRRAPGYGFTAQIGGESRFVLVTRHESGTFKQDLFDRPIAEKGLTMSYGESTGFIPLNRADAGFSSQRNDIVFGKA